MRTFELYDSTKRGRRAVASLFCENAGDAEGGYRMHIRISPSARPDELPLMLGIFASRGEREVPDEWARRWVAERIPPQGRHNMGEILRANGLDAYDEAELLAASQGRSAQDDFLLREVPGSRVDYAFVSLEGGGPARAGCCESVGAEIARRRKAAGLTQQELAERTGIGQGAISRIESGRGNPTLDTLEALVEGIGCSLEVKIV